VATISRGPGVLVVNPSLPAKSVPELIADAKSNSGKITVASAGVGSAPYMYWQLFRSVTNVDMVHVPYHGGGPAITDLLGGQVQVYFSTFAAAIQYIRAGKLRALAVTGAARAPVLPDVPALAEFLPGYEASIYVGISAPRDTPTAIVGRLHQAVNQALAESKVTQRIEDLGDAPLVTTTDGFTKLVADETEKWRTVIRKANIKAE
jgi:tripartite-type tricarboxylate transporter receptor subunit TctC